MSATKNYTNIPCTLTNLTQDDLNLIHSSLSHQVIDICRHMRHTNITCIMHNSLAEQMTELQKVIHKIGVVIESRKLTINNSTHIVNEWTGV